MSIRAVAHRLIQNGRLLYRFIKPQEPIKTVVDCVKINAHEAKAIESSLRPTLGRSAFQTFGYQVHYHARRIFVENILNRVTNSLAGDLRKRATKRLFFGDSRPFFALVGVSLASGTGILTKDDELEGLCWEIREAVSKLKWATRDLDDSVKVDIGLKDLTLGPSIAKGCSAVVYAARWKEDSGGTPTSHQETANDLQNGPSINLSDPLSTFPLAVKMMFNYDAESNALSILRAMHRETVPAQFHISSEELSGWEKSLQERTKALPPHPNVVDMQYVFADRVPQLPGSFSLYPDALPARINPNGSGRNMSLFLLMKRYDCSLSEYLQGRELTPRVSLLLLTQLLEGVAHINLHGVAHRDLKSDNLLIDLSEGEDWPILVVSDFGCCLADRKLGLRLPYHTPDTDKGGNAALMAPEVANAVPGPFTTINYEKSDAWAVGTVAHELFGSINPFYLRGGDGQRPLLRSSTYKEDELPELPSTVPSIICALIRNLLHRDPSKRMTADMAANVCQLFLWAPKSWMEENIPSSNEVLQWLLFLTSKLVCERGLPVGSYSQRRTFPEYQLISSFLARVHLRKVREAVTWMRRHRPDDSIPATCSSSAISRLVALDRDSCSLLKSIPISALSP
ncbi:serine/threonine-protein kinase Pink1, mitochondrial [Ischnura elegans]|uniref:serine/threonine-protein kinase Pink1, mitochondrial n=1 Tax=Ischnura elegans TaxID=197161 RepID=UPI001ED883C4|nr:serine/threonine-protein kinase Pink1, mitochondrial [Ischnura elegans]